MKPGRLTTEFWMIVAAAVFAAAVSLGWLTPAKVATATDRVNQAAGEIPALIAAVKGLIESLAPLGGLAGLAWAYLKRRSEIKLETIKADAEIRKIDAQARFYQARPPVRAAQAGPKAPEAAR